MPRALSADVRSDTGEGARPAKKKNGPVVTATAAAGLLSGTIKPLIGLILATVPRTTTLNVCAGGEVVSDPRLRRSFALLREVFRGQSTTACLPGSSMPPSE